MIDIRLIRMRLGLTQAELATKLGLHQSTICRLENGTLPVDERTKLALEALALRADAVDAALNTVSLSRAPEGAPVP